MSETPPPGARPLPGPLPGQAPGQIPVQPNDPAGNRLIGFSVRFWTMVVLTGVGAGIGAGVLMELLRAVQHLCYGYPAGTFLDGVRATPPERRVIVLLCAGLLTSAGLFVLRHGRGGSGGKLNERIWFHAGRLAEFKTLVQSALSITIVGMGASLGRETAPKQAGAAIASWLSRHAGLSSAESRLLAACGAGAGMGAVYNVPLGGALFALEVLLGTLALPLIPPALATSFIATAVAWTMLPNTRTYDFGIHAIAPTQLVWALLFGPVAGLASVLYVRLIVLADGVKRRPRLARALPVPVFGVLGAVAIRYPGLLGNGKDIAQLTFFGAMGAPLLLALLFLKPLATASCLASGAPGGLFTPSLSFGALLGGLLGQAWSLLWPGAASGSYAMIGAAAMLAASMQAPLAAVVLMLELSHHLLRLMVPVLIAVAGASATARRIDPRSVYSGRVSSGRRAAETAPADVHIAYADLVTRAARTISVAATYPAVLERFASGADRDRPLYVLDEEARLSGWIAARDLQAAPALAQVLSAGAAGDLMRPVAPLRADAARAEVLARLRDEPAGELPVVDPASGRLAGVAVRREGGYARGGHGKPSP